MKLDKNTKMQVNKPVVHSEMQTPHPQGENYLGQGN